MTIDRTTWEAIASYMDDDIRETVHAELAPCTPDAFLKRYCQLDEDFLPGLLKVEFYEVHEAVMMDEPIIVYRNVSTSNGEWDLKACEKLCREAGLADEWTAADG